MLLHKLYQLDDSPLLIIAVVAVKMVMMTTPPDVSRAQLHLRWMRSAPTSNLIVCMNDDGWTARVRLVRVEAVFR
jgi:hypothetical protein